jgi:hypothetical protein
MGGDHGIDEPTLGSGRGLIGGKVFGKDSIEFVGTFASQYDHVFGSKSVLEGIA